MDLKSFIDNVERKAAISIKTNDNDYIGADGLLYCGKCNTRKQTRVNILGIEKTPYCLCQCEVEKREREEAEIKRRELARKVSEYRRMGFPESMMQEWTFDNSDGTNDKIMEAARKYALKFDEFRKQGKGLLLFGTAGVGAIILSWKDVYSICSIISCVLATLGYWQKKPVNTKILSIFVCMSQITYGFFIRSVSVVTNELIMLSSIAIFFVRIYIEKKKAKISERKT